MARVAGILTVLGGMLLAQGPALAQSASNPVSFLTEMLGIRSRAPDSAPMSITAPAPAKGKAAVRSGAPTDITASTTPQKPPAKAAAKPKKPAAPVVAAADPAAPADKQAATGGDAAASHPAQGATGPIDPPAERKVVKLPPFRGGGSQAVCVRTCDGFFFPVNYEGAHSNDRYAEACQLACPAAPTEVYFMPRGGDLTQASTQRGVRYSALPTAFKYRKERDASCACKAQNQSWGEVLAQAEPLVKQNPKDILVTPERSIELARPVDPAVAAAEAEAAKAAKPAKTAAKTASKTKSGKPAATTASAKGKIAPDQAWRTTNRFVRIDPEPTASIR